MADPYAKCELCHRRGGYFCSRAQEEIDWWRDNAIDKETSREELVTFMDDVDSLVDAYERYPQGSGLSVLERLEWLLRELTGDA